jgi:hypothetical protein
VGVFVRFRQQADVLRRNPQSLRHADIVRGIHRGHRHPSSDDRLLPVDGSVVVGGVIVLNGTPCQRGCGADPARAA